MNPLILFSILLSSIIAQWSCVSNADRSNPLDPKSENFNNVGMVTGETRTYYPPSSPISDVEIRMEPGSFITNSNSSGKFLFENVPAGSYIITAQKENYALVENSIGVKLNQTTTVELNLDGLPFILSFSVSSSRISRWFPEEDLLLLDVQARVDDPNGFSDIKLVTFEIPDLSFTDTLEINQSLNTYSKQVLQTQLPNSSLHDILGRQLYLKVQDQAGFECKSQPNFLARVIDVLPEAVFPQGLVVLTKPRPVLIWKANTLSFNYTFSVELLQVYGGVINDLIWFQPDINKTEKSIAVPDSLIDGIYFWRVAIVDDFGNLSRDKERSFRIN